MKVEVKSLSIMDEEGLRNTNGGEVISEHLKPLDF